MMRHIHIIMYVRRCRWCVQNFIATVGSLLMDFVVLNFKLTRIAGIDAIEYVKCWKKFRVQIFKFNRNKLRCILSMHKICFDGIRNVRSLVHQKTASNHRTENSI